MIMQVNVLDFWAAMNAPITGVSYRMKSQDGLIETVVNTENEKNDLIAAGYTVVNEIKAV